MAKRGKARPFIMCAPKAPKMSEAGFKSRWDFKSRLTPESYFVIFFENVISALG